MWRRRSRELGRNGCAAERLRAACADDAHTGAYSHAGSGGDAIADSDACTCARAGSGDQSVHLACPGARAYAGTTNPCAGTSPGACHGAARYSPGPET